MKWSKLINTIKSDLNKNVKTQKAIKYFLVTVYIVEKNSDDTEWLINFVVANAPETLVEQQYQQPKGGK